jgi:NADH-ubiquinone oxidoreductase chain 5
LFSIIAIIFSEFSPELISNFKLSKLGYTIFGFFNQRFLVELFYNKYITNLVLKLGGQTTKTLDKGSIEQIGPYGLEKGLVNLSKNIGKLSTGIPTNYALFIFIGFIVYINLLFLSFYLTLLFILIFFIKFNINTNSNIYDSLQSGILKFKNIKI